MYYLAPKKYSRLNFIDSSIAATAANDASPASHTFKHLPGQHSKSATTNDFQIGQQSKTSLFGRHIKNGKLSRIISTTTTTATATKTATITTTTAAEQ